MIAARNVEALVTMQPIAVDTASPDRDGMLVIANGMLIGVLVRLEAPEHENLTGSWAVEAIFGGLQGLRPQPFDTPEEATRWFRHKMRSGLATV